MTPRHPFFVKGFSALLVLLLHYIDLSLVGDIGGDVGVVRSLHAMTY
jgi:hypothetical protein